ncbi:hypothetical protein ColTof4_06575 [Colletotrichum tofieldiae]|nr:hypothetical protein ColTof3_11540 [Colletotrichum tofieldiae]GKT74152.1 hypothetical protein ColTof4_06575 [Colletotrichum tofieldiae]GKT97126.1 hypothetical protein Ct61P_14976 [Colletotrichum tofieldiae]
MSRYTGANHSNQPSLQSWILGPWTRQDATKAGRATGKTPPDPSERCALTVLLKTEFTELRQSHGVLVAVQRR